MSARTAASSGASSPAGAIPALADPDPSRPARSLRKVRSRRLLDTTKTELKAMAAPEPSGLRNPSAASSSAAALQANAQNRSPSMVRRYGGTARWPRAPPAGRRGPGSRRMHPSQLPCRCRSQGRPAAGCARGHDWRPFKLLSYLFVAVVSACGARDGRAIRSHGLQVGLVQCSACAVPCAGHQVPVDAVGDLDAAVAEPLGHVGDRDAPAQGGGAEAMAQRVRDELRRQAGLAGGAGEAMSSQTCTD